MGFRDRIMHLFETGKGDVKSQGEGFPDDGSVEDEEFDFEDFKSAQIRNFKYLDDLIHSTNEIVLDSDIVLGEDEESVYGDGIDVDVDGIVIDGNGYAIDSLGKARIFLISAKSIVLKNITFKNGSNEDGGAIYVNSGNLEIIECIFNDNVSQNDGGAIYNVARLDVFRSTFENNSAKSLGGAIYNGGELNMSQSRLNKNEAGTFGGVICNEGEIIISESDLMLNNAPSGGALYNEGPAFNCFSCKFESNSCSRDGSIVLNEQGHVKFTNSHFSRHDAGNVIANRKYMDFSNCKFDTNSTEHVMTNHADARLILFNSLFHNNSNEMVSVYNGGECTIAGTAFRGNASYSDMCGNDVVNDGNLTLSRPKFESDNAILNNGNLVSRNINHDELERILCYVVPEPPFDITPFGFEYLDKLIRERSSNEILLNEDVRLERHEIDFYEGGVHLDVDDLVIDGNGHTIDANNLSRIFVVNARNVTLKNIEFINGYFQKNYFFPVLRDSGAIYIRPNASLYLVNCRFVNNSSESHAGAINNKGEVLLEDNDFLNNSSKVSAGAILNQGFLSIVGNCSFNSNKSPKGAAICNRGKLKVTNDVSFSDNESDCPKPVFNDGLIETEDFEPDFNEFVYDGPNAGNFKYSPVDEHISDENPVVNFKLQEDDVAEDESEIKREIESTEKESPIFNESDDSSFDVYSSGWRYAIIFISSTFNDMHAERDYLVKEVFPELSEWCEKHKIRLIDVDLRWGVRMEDTENKATLGTCLHHIDNSRPFFMGFLGQRRGWIPDFASDINEDTKNRYPQIRNMDDISITEMEIEHSLLGPLCEIVDDKKIPHKPNKYSLFFFRDDDYVEQISPEQRLIYTNDEASNIAHADFKLDEIKRRIREKESAELDNVQNDKIHIKVFDYNGEWDFNLEIPELSHLDNDEWRGSLTNFKCGDEPLKEVIISAIKQQFKCEFPQNFQTRKLTKFEEYLDQEEIFCYLNSEGFIPRPEYTAKLNEYVYGSSDKICLITAKAGYGKTMLLSNFSLDFQFRHPNVKLYKRFCGASNFSLNSYSLWKSIIDEAKISRSEKFYPHNLDELKINFEYILNAIADKSNSLIVIDAVNQMGDGLDMLRWISKYELPDNLKIILSVKKDSDEGMAEESDYYSFEIGGLDEGAKRKLINKYLENYLKTLDDEQIEAICSFEASENPLFLKILLSELRVFGSFSQLNEKIRKFGTSPVSAFKHVLDRLESEERKTDIVPLIFSLLANARSGLSEDELVQIIEIHTDFDRKTIRDCIRLNIRQIRQFMMKKDGRHDFFYDSFKIASFEKYGDRNEILLDYFTRKADPRNDYSFINPDENNLRALNELPFHLNNSKKYFELKKLLTSYSFIKNKLDLSDIYNLLSDYNFSQDHEFRKAENHPVVLIGIALELSASALIKDKNQLPSQLWGRLIGIDDASIRILLDELIIKTEYPWFKSKSFSLYSPDSPIIKKISSLTEKVVTDIVFHPDRIIIWGNDDGTLNLYDYDEDYFEILARNDSKIIKLIPDALELYVGYENGEIERWYIPDKKIVEKYPKIDDEITDIFYSKSYGKIFAISPSALYSVSLLNHEILKESIETYGSFDHFLISQELESIIVCEGQQVTGWDIYEGRMTYRKNFYPWSDDESEGIWDSIQFMGCIGRFLILIDSNGEQKIWNMLKQSGGGEAIDSCFTVSSKDTFKKAIAFEDSRRIMTLSDMGCLNFWNLPSPRNPYFNSSGDIKEIHEIQTGIVSPSAIAENWCGEENWVVIGNENNNVYIIDLDKGHGYEKHQSTVLFLIIDDENLLTCSDDGDIYIWDFESEEFKFSFSNDLRVAGVLFNHSDKTLVSAGVKVEKDGRMTNKITTWKVGDDDAVDEVVSYGVIDVIQNASGICWAGENKLRMGFEEFGLNQTPTALVGDSKSENVFVGFEDGSIVRYPDESRFEADAGCPITRMKIMEDNLVVGCENGLIEMFDFNGNLIRTLEGHDGTINDVCSFECRLLSVSMDNTLKLWDLKTNECIHTQFLDIPATAIGVKDQKLVLGDSLGNVRFFDFENF